MASAEEVKKLASLARVSVTEEELPTFVKEFDAILAYVGQLEALDLPTGAQAEVPALRNVMRLDGEPHAAGLYTEKLAEQFPLREGDALVVKQVITHE
ncbi:MAG: Asp-tRNA(Asn)/Glu-tRNA(Gln) amidotransferase subunit GatC [Candidatus Paceibacterota bacterium]